MKQYREYLNQFKEVGEVREIQHSVVYVKGLPGARPNEVVMAENGELGQVMSLGEEMMEVLLLTPARLKVGTKLVRTGEWLSVPVGQEALGKTLTALGQGFGNNEGMVTASEQRLVDIAPLPLERRENVRDPFVTGLALVDLIIPLGTGQRELIIGDRKIGKTFFIKQAMVSHAQRGGICVYAGMGRRLVDVLDMEAFLTERGVRERTVMMVSMASDPAGLVFTTPYAAMSMAEYFRDQGIDVLIILDDLTIHAKFYREIALLAKRFPGRSAYPGDIFYAHARLMERAGNFDTGSITCLPLAETVQSDIRGYIQTNLMSMTDGHVFFDHDLYNQGRRPAIDHFVSVTRVGRQTQTPLLKSLSQNLTSFLVHHKKLKQLMHFGGELSGDVKKSLALGDMIVAFFDQSSEVVVPLNVNVVFIASIWVGLWEGIQVGQMKQGLVRLTNAYNTQEKVKAYIDTVVSKATEFTQLLEMTKGAREMIVGK